MMNTAYRHLPQSAFAQLADVKYPTMSQHEPTSYSKESRSAIDHYTPLVTGLPSDIAASPANAYRYLGKAIQEVHRGSEILIGHLANQVQALQERVQVLEKGK